MQEILETQVWTLGLEDPWEEGMETHFSILAWSIPRTEEPGGLPSIGSRRVGQEWSHLSRTHNVICMASCLAFAETSFVAIVLYIAESNRQALVIRWTLCPSLLSWVVMLSQSSKFNFPLLDLYITKWSYFKTSLYYGGFVNFSLKFCAFNNLRPCLRHTKVQNPCIFLKNYSFYYCVMLLLLLIMLFPYFLCQYTYNRFLKSIFSWHFLAYFFLIHLFWTFLNPYF